MNIYQQVVVYNQKAEKPFGVPHHILVSFQDQKTNSKFGFYQGNDQKDAYLTKPYVNWEALENWNHKEWEGPTIPLVDIDAPALNVTGWDVPIANPTYPNNMVENIPSDMGTE